MVTYGGMSKQPVTVPVVRGKLHLPFLQSFTLDRRGACSISVRVVLTLFSHLLDTAKRFPNIMNNHFKVPFKKCFSFLLCCMFICVFCCYCSFQSALIFKDVKVRGFWVTQWKRVHSHGTQAWSFRLYEINLKKINISLIYRDIVFPRWKGIQSHAG